MITNFENITHNLTPNQIALVDKIIKIIITIKSPMVSYNLRSLINKNLKDDEYLNSIEFRKIVNYIRSQSLLPIIANCKGYYVSYDTEVINKQIVSLNERSHSITNAANGLLKFI
jgi:hypothetical protein